VALGYAAHANTAIIQLVSSTTGAYVTTPLWTRSYTELPRWRVLRALNAKNLGLHDLTTVFKHKAELEGLVIFNQLAKILPQFESEHICNPHHETWLHGESDLCPWNYVPRKCHQYTNSTHHVPGLLRDFHNQTIVPRLRVFTEHDSCFRSHELWKGSRLLI